MCENLGTQANSSWTGNRDSGIASTQLRNQNSVNRLKDSHPIPLNTRIFFPSRVTISSSIQIPSLLDNCVQLGSEYQTSLVFQQWKFSRMPNGLVFKCHLNTRLNLLRYSDHHVNTGYLKTEQVTVLYSDVNNSDPRCSIFHDPRIYHRQ